ncbi:dipeptide/oligopeptide/nickel ABC transporter permease/ATP-binding protein [Okibacterium endophyticum]
MSTPVPDTTGSFLTAPEVAARRARPAVANIITRKPVAFAGLIFLLLVVFVAILGPAIAPYDPLVGSLADALQGPSWAHPLGTDQLGRDTLSRLIVGTGPTVLYTSQVVAVALALGVCLGTLAGFVGGKADTAVISLSDILMSIPGMVLLLVALTIFQDNMEYAMFAVGVLISGPLMRVIRASTLAFRQELFIEAAQVSGLPTRLILVRHILPRVMGTVLIQTSLLIGLALLLVTGVAYLGFGTQPPYPSWGSMIGDGAQIFGTNPLLMTVAGLAIASTVVAAALLGDGLRDLTVERWSGERAKRLTRRQRRATMTPPAIVTADDVAGSEALLAVRGLEISYLVDGDEVRVVHGIDLDVPVGGTVGLVGESGSGKSATARAILGILRGGRVTGGSIRLDGEDIADIGRSTPARRVGLRMAYISQEPHVSLDPTWRVGAQLVEALRRHDQSLTKSAARGRALDLLGKVQMRDREEVFRAYPHELSGGMAQRVAIARALCSDPRLLIADEPTTALDVTVQAEILDLLRDIQASTGMSILLITHDWGVVADLCQDAVVLCKGSVVEAGSVREIVRHPKDPYTATLLLSSPAVMLADAKSGRAGHERTEATDEKATA